MRIKDSGLGFGLVTILNHWIGAIIILGFFACNLSALALEGEEQTARLAFTANLGFLWFCHSCFRIFWRLKSYYPMPLGPTSPAQVLISRSVAFAMLLAGVFLPLVFLAQLSAQNIVVQVGGLPFHLILPIPEAATFILALLFWLGMAALGAGFLLHLYGAFSHHFLQKDDTLPRLLGKHVEM